MKPTITACCLLALTSAASADPFQIIVIESGGGLPGIDGAGISVNGGGFFTSVAAGGNNIFGGLAAGFTAANYAEFDSHFSLSGFGPSARNRALNPERNSTLTLDFYGDYGPPGSPAANFDEFDGMDQNGFGPFVNPNDEAYFAPNSHVGDPDGDGSNSENSARAAFGRGSGSTSHFAPNPPPAQPGRGNIVEGRSNLDGIFVGRFTIGAGRTLSGGMFVHFPDFFSPNGLVAIDLTMDGPAMFLYGNTSAPKLIALRSFKVGTVDITQPSGTTADGIFNKTPFGLADVYDLWVLDLPNPGTLALITVGIVAFGRRRLR